MSDILDRAEAIKAKLGNGELHWQEYKEIVPELIDEIKQQAAYVARLEAAFLKLYISSIPGLNDAEEHARRCLERIKRGEQE